MDIATLGEIRMALSEGSTESLGRAVQLLSAVDSISREQVVELRRQADEVSRTIAGMGCVLTAWRAHLADFGVAMDGYGTSAEFLPKRFLANG